MVYRLLAFAVVAWGMAGAVGAKAQDNARAVREQNLQMSRYEQLIGKLMDQNEKLQSDIRIMQRQQEALLKDVESANANSRNAMDEMQRLKNTNLQNVQAAQRQMAESMALVKNKLWGDGTRDCADLSVKHQQIKVMMKPDGSKSVRFLCFDGKALLLGSELYMPTE